MYWVDQATLPLQILLECLPIQPLDHVACHSVRTYRDLFRQSGPISPIEDAYVRGADRARVAPPLNVLADGIYRLRSSVEKEKGVDFGVVE